MTVLAEKYGNQTIGNEVLISKFYKLAKEHFQITVKSDTDPISIIKESVRFFSLDLPAELKEIFIPFNNAPLFWVYDSSLLLQIEEYMKLHFKGMVHNELHKQIKENYSRWATTRLKSEKEYYSTLTVNFIERDINKHNFFKLILKGIILTYQITFYNPARALEAFKSAIDIISTLRLNDQTKLELQYILKLYIGFVHLKESNYSEANAAFKEALEIRSNGCTAKIYSALTELHLGNEELVIYYLREVIQYDVHRLGIALRTNNFGMFNYFFKNAFIFNVFHENDFSKANDAIQVILEEFHSKEQTSLTVFRDNLDEIMSKHLDEYYDDEIKKSFDFFGKIFAGYATTTNTLLHATFPEIRDRINEVVEKIVSRVREDFYGKVREKLQSLDSSIIENMNAEKQLAEELENFKKRMKESLNDSVQKINENFNDEALAIEERINDLPHIDRYNPRASLFNNMTYNIIIALVVFFIGGVAGYSNRSLTDASEYNSIFSYLLITGSKWGAISFLVGVVITLLLSAIVVIERYDVKLKLQKRLHYLKVEKESLIAETKNSSEHKEKIMIENINVSIAQHRKRIEELKTLRAGSEKEMMNEANQKIEEITKDIIKLVQ